MRQTPCILTTDGICHFPRPTSVGAGQARSIWAKRLTGMESAICHPDYWDSLAKTHPVQVLTEHDDGSWNLTPCGVEPVG